MKYSTVVPRIYPDFSFRRAEVKPCPHLLSWGPEVSLVKQAMTLGYFVDKHVYSCYLIYIELSVSVISLKEVKGSFNLF